MKIAAYSAIVVLALLVLAAALDLGPKSADERSSECARALASSIGHDTKGYADKAAYDAEVLSKCAGFNIPDKLGGR